MPPVNAAVLSYSHLKSCFLSVPKSLINTSFAFKGLHVFKLEYEKDQKAYFSCCSDSVLQSREVDVVVKLNGKFASMLGLKDNEQVLIQQVERCSPVERICLEPLDSDDWEMMQLNANFIETELLRQIRVVWKNQVFPIWVNKISFFAKVVELIPDVEPALLVEWTLIDILPKERKNTIPSSLTNTSGKPGKNAYKQYHHLRRSIVSKNTDSSVTSITSDDSESSNQDSIGSQTNLLPPKAGFSILRYLMKSTSQSESLTSDAEKQDFNDFQPLNFDFLLRVISMSKSKESSKLPLVLQATTVFISAQTFLSHCHSDTVPPCFVARLSKLQSPQQKKDLAASELQDGKSHNSKEKKKENLSDTEKRKQIFSAVYVNVIVLNSAYEGFDVPSALFRSSDFVAVPLELKRRLGAEICSVVRCQSAECPPSNIDSVCLVPLEKLHSPLDDNFMIVEFQKWIAGADLQETSVVLCDGTLAKLPVNAKGKSCDFAVILNQTEHELRIPASNSDSCSLLPSYGFMNESKFKRVVVKIGSYTSHIRKSVWYPGSSCVKTETLYQSNPYTSLKDLGGIKEISEKVMADMEMWFKLRPMYTLGTIPCFKVCGSLLVYGAKGVGKSSFLQALCKNLINYPHFIYTCFIRCLPLRGKRADTIVRKWELYFSECVHRQPSLLVFDDLDQLASSTTTLEEENSPDGLYYMNVAQIFAGLLKKVVSNNLQIVIVASSKSIHSLHPSLTKTRGHRMFQTMLEMKLPDREQRIDILKSLISSKAHISSECIVSLPWKNIAVKTEGAVAQDLVILLERAVHAALVRAKYERNSSNENRKVLLVENDFKISLRGYTPSNLRGLQLQKKTKKSWKDIGGLKEVKNAIQQILTWPNKYKSLYKNYHLKPQHNILLYGAPGTGKTLIASVVANECDMNFISIKGPELLSKYIGASEQSVRDLFNRAMVAKPCILFFDEFDALVPRRGHDSTGVTDRVVNQFLTQMDGVESLDGVYVLAATSRLELIDPALLRPGRLDKCLYCPLPDEKDRLEILLALSQKLSLAADVDWSEISAMTENYSGADLQALLYSAQVKAFHDFEKERASRYIPTADATLSEIMQKVVYMPSIEKGVLSASEMESKKIIEELDIYLSNIDKDKHDSRLRSDSTISAYIERKHLIYVLCDMKPSVSGEERYFYERTFEKFHHKGGTTTSDAEVKRVTLA